MCGRKTLTKGKIEIIQDLLVDDWAEDWEPSFNIAPTQNTPVLLYKEKRQLRTMRWGLVPFWAKDLKMGSRMINARAETLTEKPAFRSLLRSKRCVVVTDGYYEWQQTNSGKQPFYIHHRQGQILPMAGLWDKWLDENEKEWNTYTVITTEPAESISHIHNRMPVILNKPHMDYWINCDYPPDEALEYLKPYENPLEFYPVSKFVNSPANNTVECKKYIKLEQS